MAQKRSCVPDDIVDGKPIGRDLKKLRRGPISKSEVISAKLTNDIIESLGEQKGYQVWNTIRGIPPWKRQACVLIEGETGSGKTLLSTIISRGLQRIH